MKDFKDLLDKVKKLEEGEKLDLSSGEDLSIGIMNLISIEEHLFFSGNKTNDSKYFELLNEIREMRKDLLKRLIKDYEGEVWCVSKHLLASSMRLMEVGTKLLSKGDKKEAEDMFKKSYQLYNLFWGLNLGVMQVEGVKQGNSDKVELLDEKKLEVKGSANVFDKLGQLVQKVVDCCKE